MSLIKQTIEHRAKLYAVIEAFETKQAEVTDQFETSVKIAAAEHKRASEKLATDLKAFIADEYGEPTEAEVAEVMAPVAVDKSLSSASVDSDEINVKVEVETP